MSTLISASCFHNYKWTITDPQAALIHLSLQFWKQTYIFLKMQLYSVDWTKTLDILLPQFVIWSLCSQVFYMRRLILFFMAPLSNKVAFIQSLNNGFIMDTNTL